MYNGLLHAHSGIRWVVLALLIITVIKAFSGWLGKKEYSSGDSKLAMLTFNVINVQFLLGVALYFISPKVVFSSETMGNDVLRFFTMEHITFMIIAIALISIGYSKAKKASEDLIKHKKIAIMYGIGLLLILAGIPWPFLGLGSSWF